MLWLGYRKDVICMRAHTHQSPEFTQTHMHRGTHSGSRNVARTVARAVWHDRRSVTRPGAHMHAHTAPPAVRMVQSAHSVQLSSNSPNCNTVCSSAQLPQLHRCAVPPVAPHNSPNCTTTPHPVLLLHSSPRTPYTPQPEMHRSSPTVPHTSPSCTATPPLAQLYRANSPQLCQGSYTPDCHTHSDVHSATPTQSAPHSQHHTVSTTHIITHIIKHRITHSATYVATHSTTDVISQRIQVTKPASQRIQEISHQKTRRT